MSLNEFHAPNLSFIGHRDHVNLDYYYKLCLELVLLLSYLRCFSVGEKRTARNKRCYLTVEKLSIRSHVTRVQNNLFNMEAFISLR